MQKILQHYAKPNLEVACCDKLVKNKNSCSDDELGKFFAPSTAEVTGPFVRRLCGEAFGAFCSYLAPDSRAKDLNVARNAEVKNGKGVFSALVFKTPRPVTSSGRCKI